MSFLTDKWGVNITRKPTVKVFELVTFLTAFRSPRITLSKPRNFFLQKLRSKTQCVVINVINVITRLVKIYRPLEDLMYKYFEEVMCVPDNGLLLSFRLSKRKRSRQDVLLNITLEWDYKKLILDLTYLRGNLLVDRNRSDNDGQVPTCHWRHFPECPAWFQAPFAVLSTLVNWQTSL